MSMTPTTELDIVDVLARIVDKACDRGDAMPRVGIGTLQKAMAEIQKLRRG